MSQWRCATCKNWRRYTEPSDLDFYGHGAGLCQSNKFSDTVAPMDPPYDEVQVHHEHGFFDYTTGEAFGCVHWEGK